MTKILIVDDNPIDRQLAGRLLQKYTGWGDLAPENALTIIHANDGVEATALAEREKPDLILTDLHMPNRDGLELVEEIKLKQLGIPIVLMTAHGSEEIAIQALKTGAASYVPKKLLAQDLVETVLSVLDAHQANRSHARLLECLTQSESHFTLDNEPALIPPLIGYLKDSRFRICGSDETGLVRITLALREAVLNAMHHGNLELSSTLREGDEKQYHELTAQRKTAKPYASRRVYVAAKDTPEGSTYMIRDEGPGFDPSKLPDPLDPENMDKISGRGLLLIRTFMDEVKHNAKGNEITMVKRAGE
jgi:CheY-like chemotaxis protein/anti-sigma regulatory factor (Ser/Thr protein kinase)